MTEAHDAAQGLQELWAFSAAAAATPAGGFCLFENLRFHAGEEADEGFGRVFEALHDVFWDFELA